MKYLRTLNIVLAGILAGTLLAFTTPAAAAGTMVGVHSVHSVHQGDDFVASITIEDVTGFDAAQYDITYDPDVIRVIEVTSGNINDKNIPVDMWGLVPAHTPGTVRVINNISGTTGVSGSGYLA
jgi:hypothetical protein